MKLGSFLVSSIVFWSYVQSQFIRRFLDEEECQQCCANAVAEFSNTSFNLAACQNNGCVRGLGDGNQCEQIFGNNIANAQRLGCEIGRDFFTTGVSGLFDNARTQVFECQQNGRFKRVDQEFQALLTNPVFIRNAATCRLCCDNVNDFLDLGPANTPEDFDRTDCENTCVTLQTCFEDNSHIDRTACLIALDFSIQALTTLEAGIVSCEEDGNFKLLALTDFPTLAPTDNAAAIAGGTVGGLAALGLFSLIIVLFLRRPPRTRSLSERKLPTEAPIQQYHLDNPSTTSTLFWPMLKRSAPSLGPPAPPKSVQIANLPRPQTASNNQVIYSPGKTNVGVVASPNSSSDQGRKKRRRKRKNTNNSANGSNAEEPENKEYDEISEMSDGRRKGSTQPRYNLDPAADLIPLNRADGPAESKEWNL